MSDPIDVMADELVEHRTLAGGSCRCGHDFKPGENIQRHRALAAYTAMTLGSLGLDYENRHAAVMTTLRLLGKINDKPDA